MRDLPATARKSRAELRAEFEAILQGPIEVDWNSRDFDTARERRRLKVRDQYLHGMYRKNQDEPVRRGTLAEIAASVGVSPSTARRYLRELGVESRGRGRRAGA